MLTLLDRHALNFCFTLLCSSSLQRCLFCFKKRGGKKREKKKRGGGGGGKKKGKKKEKKKREEKTNKAMRDI